MALTYWEVNFAGDLYNTNTSGKVGINNQNPLLELDVIGSVGLTSLLEFKKPGQDRVQLKSASAFGYDFSIWNETLGVHRLFIDSNGKVAIGTNAATGKITVVETTPGNAWAAASFTNTSSVGFGLEVTGGNEGNSTAVFKNYANIVGATLSGRGELFVRSWITSNAGTSVSGNHHFRMENNHLRFSSLLVDEETGVNNTGSNYAWRRYADDGSLLGTILNIERSTGALTWTGNTTFNNSVTVLGSFTANSVNIPLWKLSDVSNLAIPSNLEGGIIRAIGGEWKMVDPDTLPKQDLTPYLTKVEAASTYSSITALNAHINNHSNPHQVSLQEVLTVNNATTLEIISSNRIVAGSLMSGNTTIAESGSNLVIDNNLYVDGQLSFNTIDMYLSELNNVDNDVDVAPDGYILKKINGVWTAAIDKADSPPDLSSYYTKVETDGRYVNITGDFMTGPLSITSLDTNLELHSSTGTSSVKIFNGLTEIFSTDVTVTGIRNMITDADKYVIAKPLGSVITVNENGSVTYGDATKSSSTLGNILVTSVAPSIGLVNSGTNVHGSGFRILNTGATTSLQVGAGLSLTGLSSLVVLNGGVGSSNVELRHNNIKRLETTSTGVKIYDVLDAGSLLVNGISVYKSTDGKFVIDGDVVITGNYLQDWTGPGTGNTIGVEQLVQLTDVNIPSIAAIEEPFVVGRKLSAGNQVTYLTKTDLVSAMGLVTTSVLQAHITDPVPHVGEVDRLGWDNAANMVSRLYNWDLIYASYTSKEVGISDTGETGAGISTNDMKYLFYWDAPGGDRYGLKTLYADNAGALNNKPWDEFRYSRAIGYSTKKASELLERGLYDLGTVHAYESDVPFDDSWQVETIDSSYIYNQSAPEAQKHKYQLANRWVARDNSFDLWARGHDGATQEWLPWVQMMHTGNMPVSVELYPVLPTDAYDELENESNWTYQFSEPGDEFELYIGETEGIDWAFNIGHRIVNKQYIYEVTPIGIKRTGNSKFVTVEKVTDLTTTTIPVSTSTDRLEITMNTAANKIYVVIDHNREKPVVISLINSTLFGVEVQYTVPSLPNAKIIDMEPNVIIEVHPGIWELN